MSDSPPPGPSADAAEADDVEVHEGAALVQLSFIGTGALLVAAGAGALSPDGAGALTAWVSGVLFAIGVVLFLWGYAVGVVRSREEQITLGGLFFLSGTAPKVVRFRFGWNTSPPGSFWKWPIRDLLSPTICSRVFSNPFNAAMRRARTACKAPVWACRS